MNLTDRFGINLSRRREGAGLSQAQLAEKAGLRRAEISKMEKRESVCGSDTLAKLCGVLEIELDALMEGIVWIPAEGSTDGHLETQRVFLDDLEDLVAELESEES
jgi:transcriptional regulator with XRE-family HTH domain